jgi:hypothetical protein
MMNKFDSSKVAPLIRAAAIGNDIRAGEEIYRFFRSGEVVPVGEDYEADVLESGWYKQVETNSPTVWPWLLMFSSIEELINFSESLTFDQLFAINAVNVLNKVKNEY